MVSHPFLVPNYFLPCPSQVPNHISMENNPTHEPLAAVPDSSGEPHSALFLILAYLRLPDLIAVHKVCRPFRDAVAEDVLLWRHVTVEPPLSRRLTDDALVRVTSRAGGTLVSLALRDCRNITDAGLLLVADQNPAITKVDEISLDRVQRVFLLHREV